MKIFITYGTGPYLQKLIDEHPSERLLLLHKDDDQFALVHETDGDTIFKEGHAYEVLDASGNLADSGFAVLNNISVTDEGRPLFEQRFSQRARLIENEEGFSAIRVLRPLQNDTYIIFTGWKDESSFSDWQSSKAYNEAHKKRGTSEGVDQQPSIFSRPSYVTSYHVVK